MRQTQSWALFHTLGLSEETGATDAANRNRHADRNPGLRATSRRDRHYGLQAPRSRVGASQASLEAPNFLLKIIPHVDGTLRVCELVEYHLEDVTIKGARTGPAALHLSPHALAPVADLPVLEMVSAIHILADLTLGLGKVVHDYLRQPSWATPGTKKWLWRLDANLRTKAACDAVRSPQSRIGLEFPV
jgi:acetoacetate decarboxylase